MSFNILPAPQQILDSLNSYTTFYLQNRCNLAFYFSVIESLNFGPIKKFKYIKRQPPRFENRRAVVLYTWIFHYIARARRWANAMLIYSNKLITFIMINISTCVSNNHNSQYNCYSYKNPY